MTNSPPKRRPKTKKCPRCKERFKVPPRGRVPIYCSASCRQRAYEKRTVAQELERMALPYLFKADHDDIRTRDGIKRVVVDVLRELGLLPTPEHKPKERPSLRLVDKDDDDTRP